MTCNQSLRKVPVQNWASSNMDSDGRKTRGSAFKKRKATCSLGRRAKSCNQSELRMLKAQFEPTKCNANSNLTRLTLVLLVVLNMILSSRAIETSTTPKPDGSTSVTGANDLSTLEPARATPIDSDSDLRVNSARDTDPSRIEQPPDDDTEANNESTDEMPTTTTTMASTSTARADHDQQAAATQSSFLSADDGSELNFAFTTVVDQNQLRPESDLHSTESITTSEPVLPPAATTSILDETSNLIGNENSLGDIRITTRDTACTSPTESSAPKETGTETNQLVRSRKSSENSNSTIPANQRGHENKNTSQAVSSQTQAIPFDYDDFDLDYQLKLSPVSSQADGSKQPPGLYKRDQWPSHLGQAPSHLFNATSLSSSSVRGQVSNSNIAPVSNLDQAKEQIYRHATPPIMPTLLTTQSAQLTSQELNKVRPQFLFYPEQYSEFAGSNSYHSNAETLANGDLLATASNSDLRSIEQQLGQLQQQHMIQPLVNSTNLSTGLANATSQTPTINLVNGSPVASSRQSPVANLMQGFHQQHNPPVFQPTGLRAGRPRQGNSTTSTTSSTTTAETEDSQGSFFTTIVVDSSPPTTEMPAKLRHVATISPTPFREAPSTSAPLASDDTTTFASTTTTTTTTRSSPTQTRQTSPTELPTLPMPGANSSQAHQWFNYPHPNLHQNPLLLHHILNKPASFYAQNVAASSPLSLLTTSTTEASTTAGVNSMAPAKQSIGQAYHQVGPSSASSIVLQQPTTTIERPSFNGAQRYQQSPVNMTLLAMQLDEMRSIAMQSNTNRAHDGALQMIPSSDQHNPTNVLHHLVGGSSQLMLPMSQHQPPQVIHVNHHHHHQHKPPIPFISRQPQLASQIINAPSSLMDSTASQIWMPTAYNDKSRFQLGKQQLSSQSSVGDNLNAAASINSGHSSENHIGNSNSNTNSKLNLSDEDMSSYVNLLASLNPSIQAKQPEQVAATSRPDGTHVNQLIEQLLVSADQPSIKSVSPNEPIPEESPNKMNNNPEGHLSDFLKGAKLMGIPEEVQSEIYREHLTPLISNQQKTLQLISASRPRLAQLGARQQQQLKHHSLAIEGSNPLRAFMSQTDQTSHSDSTGAKTSNMHRPMLTSEQLELLRQRQKQVAFVEAIRMSLAQLREIQANNSNASSKFKGGQSKGKPSKDLTVTASEFDESITNANPAGSSQGNQVEQSSQQTSPQYQTRQPFAGPASWFPGASSLRLVTPLRQVPTTGLLRAHPVAQLAGPIQVQPLADPVWLPAASQHQSGGPQARLPWPVGMPNMARHQLYAQSTSPMPLIRLNPPTISLRPQPQQQLAQQLGPSPLLQPPGATMLAPGRVMLDRFPLASAPAYLVKLPTLTGGTITASGSLVPPAARLFRRPEANIPPAAFISATPLGALRFLSALTPPRMRFQASLPQGLPLASSGPLQVAPSMLTVGHSSPPTSFYGPSPVVHQPITASHHLQFGSHFMPTGLQAAYSNGPIPVTQADSLASSSPKETFSSVGRPQNSDKAQGGGAGDDEDEEADGESEVAKAPPHMSKQASSSAGQSQQQALNGNALARLQQATASLVELTSLASLLDEVVGSDNSPAMALANAINSLSAVQNAQHTGVQAQATGESARPLIGSNPTPGEFQRQQQSRALFWRNLMLPGFLRQQNNISPAGSSNRLTALERLIAQGQPIGGPNQPTARLKVKYIRIPVAVYETNTSGGGVASSSLQHSGSSGLQGGQLSNGLSTTTTTHNELMEPASGQTNQLGLTRTQSISGSSSDSSVSSSSNEMLFDEMSAESGPQSDYLLQPDAQPLNFLPIIRAANPKVGQLEQQLLQQMRLKSSMSDVSPFESGTYYSFASALAPVHQHGQQATRKAKKAKKMKGGDEEDENEEDEEEDDVLSTNDLPMIESLISTIIHGQPSSNFRQVPPVIDSGVSQRHPFGMGRNKFQMWPEASSTVYTYAQPGGDGSSGSSGGAQSQSTLNLFRKQRFSLTDILGVLGAKKLLSSLLGGRTRSIKAGLVSRPVNRRAKTKKMSQVATKMEQLDEATTRMPPARDLFGTLGINRNQGAGGSSLSLLKPRRRKPAARHNWIRKLGPNRVGQTAATTTTTTATSVESGTEPIANSSDEAARLASTRRPPLVFPAIVANEFDSNARYRRTKSTSTMKMMTTTRPRHRQESGRPNSGISRRPPVSGSGARSASRSKLGLSEQFALPRRERPKDLVAAGSRPTPRVMQKAKLASTGGPTTATTTTTSTTAATTTAKTSQTTRSNPIQQRLDEGDSPAPSHVEAITTIRLAVARETDRSPPAMPLYHILSDNHSQLERANRKHLPMT